jgi:hypothetical protein
VGYFESLAVGVKKPGEKAVESEVSESSTNLPAGEGQGPGRMNVRKLTMTAEVLSVDTKNNKVTVRDSGGSTRTVEVENPLMREKLVTIKPHDTIELTYTEAVAATLVPVSKK